MDFPFLTKDYISSSPFCTILPEEVVDHIRVTPLPYFPQNDNLNWGLIGHGNFTISSTSRLLTQNLTDHSQTPLLKKIWKLCVPPKVKGFAWKLIRSRPTRDGLFKAC